MKMALGKANSWSRESRRANTVSARANSATPGLPADEHRDRYERPSPGRQAKHNQRPQYLTPPQPGVGFASGTSATKPLIYLQDAQEAPSVYLYLYDYVT